MSLLKNLYNRDLGIISGKSFVIKSNTSFMTELKLSKKRLIQSVSSSITWLSLDNVDSRFLLASKSDGNFICIDTFNYKDADKNCLKVIFKSDHLKSNHSYSISCIQWYPIDSGMFFTSGMDQKFKVWDTSTLQIVDEYFLKQKIYKHNASILMSNKSKSLIAFALDNGQIRFIDLNSGSFTHTIKAHTEGNCSCVQWSPINSNIIASSGSDGCLFLWDIRSSKSFIQSFNYEKSSFLRPKKSSEITTLASNKSIAHSGSIVGLTYSSDGNHIISLGKDDALRLWDSHTGLNTLVNYGKIPLELSVSESSIQLSCTDKCNPNYVFVPSDTNLLMYEILEGTLVNKLKGHFDSINCCIYNSVFNEVYSGSKDRNILIWNSNKKTSKNVTKTSEFEKKSFGLFPNITNFQSELSNSISISDDWSD